MNWIIKLKKKKLKKNEKLKKKLKNWILFAWFSVLGQDCNEMLLLLWIVRTEAGASGSTEEHPRNAR